MVALIAKLFRIQHIGSEIEIRRRYGMLCGGVGIAFNFLLFIGKLVAGSLAHSLSVTADAFNNLSDAGSSLISLIGFEISGKAPDPDHPFGHGRIEYIAGLAVSFLILVMGGELIKSSITRIITPEPTSYSILTLIILSASILVKLYMFIYNRHYGKRFQSPAMLATAKDSLSDVASTSVVLIASLVERFAGIKIDSWCGLVIALFILYTGLSAAKDTIDPLLGNPPSHEFVAEVEKTVLSKEKILGIHDLIVHDYGPGRKIISLHAEVSADEDILSMHDVIDNIENELRSRFECDATIHMDPISVSDPKLQEIKALMENIVGGISPSLKIHDLRIVTGPTHTNIIFDMVVPYECKLGINEITDTIARKAKETDDGYCTVIHIDRPFA